MRDTDPEAPPAGADLGSRAASPGHTLVIRRFRTGDEISLNALYNRVFQQQRSLAEWRWKFEANRIASGLGSQVINVAEVNGTIVGQFPSITARFKIGDHEELLAQGLDTAVDQDYRGGANVIMELSRAHTLLLGESGALFGYGVPNPAHYKIGKWLLQYRNLCPLITLRRRLNWRHSIRRRLPNLPRPVIHAAGWLGAAAMRCQLRPVQSSSLTIREVERFDAGTDALWNHSRSRYGILAVRDARYLNWRYADRPGRPYTILQAENNGSVLGFTVLRMAEEGQDAVGLIMDLFAEPNQTTEEALAREALRWCLGKGADYVLCRLVPDDPIGVSLIECGFREHPAFPRLQVVYAPHEPAGQRYPCINDPKQWHMGYGDFDGH